MMMSYGLMRDPCPVWRHGTAMLSIDVVVKQWGPLCGPLCCGGVRMAVNVPGGGSAVNALVVQLEGHSFVNRGMVRIVNQPGYAAAHSC